MKKKIKEIGNDVYIHEPIEFINPENLVLRSNIVISTFAYIAAGRGTWVADHVHIATHTSISGGGFCILESFCGVSAGVRIITGSADPSGLTSSVLPREFQSVNRSFVHVGRYAELFSNVVVTPGVTIGEGAVVGAGSFVNKDLEPWSIYVGSPARKIGERNKDKILKSLDELKEKYNIVPTDFSEIIERVHNECKS